MKRFSFPLFWLIPLLLQSGCVSVPSREITPSGRNPATPVPPPSSTYEQPRASGTYVPPPRTPNRPSAEGRPSARESSPAVLALLTEADRQLGSGQMENAAATLERAIRIKPKSAELWHKMAQLRLQQHQPGQAENLAKKSNVLAKGDRDLIRRNWALIADARRRKGDQSGAAEAEARAAQ